MVSGAVTFDEIVKFAERYLEEHPIESAAAAGHDRRTGTYAESGAVVVRKFAQLPMLMVGISRPCIEQSQSFTASSTCWRRCS